MNNSKKYFLLLTALIISLQGISNIAKDSAKSSVPSILAGIRLQKALGFYWTNGISAECTFDKLWKRKISLGLNFMSSKMGSAFMSNAIPVYEIDISGIKYFHRTKHFKPMLRLNVGYTKANYGSDIFKNIPDHSFLVSLEAGAAYDFNFPLRVSLSGGYNIITGNGTSGMGTIFPLYVQCSLFYRICSSVK